METTRRNRQILKLAAQGWSMNRLARKYGISPQRIHQIVKREREK